MKNTIKLDNPVQINGKSYNELTYDISEITAQAFAEADARKLSASGSKNGNAAGAAELDYGLHLYLGFAAVIAVNPEIDISDLERVRGYDVMKITPPTAPTRNPRLRPSLPHINARPRRAKADRLPDRIRGGRRGGQAAPSEPADSCGQL